MNTSNYKLLIFGHTFPTGQLSPVKEKAFKEQLKALWESNIFIINAASSYLYDYINMAAAEYAIQKNCSESSLVQHYPAIGADLLIGTHNEKFITTRVKKMLYEVNPTLVLGIGGGGSGSENEIIKNTCKELEFPIASLGYPHLGGIGQAMFKEMLADPTHPFGGDFIKSLDDWAKDTAFTTLVFHKTIMLCIYKASNIK